MVLGIRWSTKRKVITDLELALYRLCNHNELYSRECNGAMVIQQLDTRNRGKNDVLQRGIHPIDIGTITFMETAMETLLPIQDPSLTRAELVQEAHANPYPSRKRYRGEL